jgi:ubiquinol-cytochrome c reductase cytochrome c1 subunit
MARDLSAFVAWTVEPKTEMGKSTGFPTIIFLTILAGLLYLVKRRVWVQARH